MTLRELLDKVKPITEPSLVSKIRQILAETKAFPEHQVYEVKEGSKWATVIQQDLRIALDETKAVAVTAYGTNAQIFEDLRTALEAAGYAAHAIYSDEQGWRTVYACGTADDDPNAFLLCCNWYDSPREVVKKQYQKADASADATTDNHDDDIELGDDEDNLFA